MKDQERVRNCPRLEEAKEDQIQREIQDLRNDISEKTAKSEYSVQVSS